MTIAAVRTVSETDDVHIIEGLGIPFVSPLKTGKDTYNTLASRNTDFVWDLFQDRLPDSDTEPQYVRPTTYHHGFDDEIRLSRVGGWSPIRTFDKGIWVQAQLDKHNAYYEAIRELLDKDALGFSIGSAEHSVRIDGKTGEWLEWPAYELALTPTPANPYAMIAARSAETARLLAIAARGWLPEGTTQGDLDDGDFAWLATDTSLPDSERRKLPYKIHGTVNEDGWKAAWSRANQEGTNFSGGPSQADVIAKLKRDKPADVTISDDAGRSAVRSEAAWDASCGAGILAQMMELYGEESDEPEQAAVMNEAIDAWQRWIALERAEIGTPADGGEPHTYTTVTTETVAYMSGVRAGKRNSASDRTLIQAMHDGAHDLHDHSTALGADCAGPMDGDGAAERSAEAQPALAVRADVDPAIRDLLIDFAKSTAAEIVGT